MESLSRAYIQAIAGRVGMNLRIEQRLEFDYGIDGTFRPIKRLGTQLVESGFPLDFQVKASTNWQLLLRKCCYWERLRGSQTENTCAVRVQNLIALLNQTRLGEWL